MTATDRPARLEQRVARLEAAGPVPPPSYGTTTPEGDRS